MIKIFLLLLIFLKLSSSLDTNADLSGKLTSTVLISKHTEFNYNNIKNLVVFGDSHSFMGTNYDNMTYSKDLLADRLNWPLRLTKIHNMTLYNYAANGAVVDLNIIYRKDFPIDFIKQYELFYERMSPGKKYYDKWNSTDTLFAIYMGSNDVGHVNNLKNNKTVNENLDDILNIFFDKVEKIYQIGGKNLMIIMVSPLDLAPVSPKSKQIYSANIQYFNCKLIEKSKELYNKYEDINIIVYDTNGEYKFIMKNYKKFNFISVTDMWKSNRSSKLDNFFWRDNTHISNKANAILAEDIDSLLNSINKQN